MDSIAAITARVAEIQGALAAAAPRQVAAQQAASQQVGSAAGTKSAASFASVLATEVAGTVRTGAAAGSAAAATQVGAYGPEQLANAAAIVRTGQEMGLSVRDQTLAVMTAMGESSLRVIDRGDAAGPDSRGLFQQRANGAWGTLADRMSPTVSATNFYTALARVQGRDAMEPTLVAHTVQRNADAYHYAKYWDAAVAVVAAVAPGSRA